MSPRLLDQPPHLLGVERRAWPLRVLLLADLPVADRAELIDDRPFVELRSDTLPPEWARWRGYCESAPGAFAQVRTSAVPCTGDELREDFDDAPEISKRSLAILSQRPLYRVHPHWPFALLVVEPEVPPVVGDEVALAEVARRAGAPIVHAGPACEPWVLSDPTRVPGALAEFAQSGWAGGADPELALALLAGRIASWARYLFTSHDWYQGDARGGLLASVPPDRFTWVGGGEGDDVVDRAIRDLSFSVTDDFGSYDVDMKLTARLGTDELSARFPFRVERG